MYVALGIVTSSRFWLTVPTYSIITCLFLINAYCEGGKVENVKEEAVEDDDDRSTLPSGVTIEKIMHRCDR